MKHRIDVKNMQKCKHIPFESQTVAFHRNNAGRIDFHKMSLPTVSKAPHASPNHTRQPPRALPELQIQQEGMRWKLREKKIEKNSDRLTPLPPSLTPLPFFLWPFLVSQLPPFFDEDSCGSVFDGRAAH